MFPTLTIFWGKGETLFVTQHVCRKIILLSSTLNMCFVCLLIKNLSFRQLCFQPSVRSSGEEVKGGRWTFKTSLRLGRSYVMCLCPLSWMFYMAIWLTYWGTFYDAINLPFSGSGALPGCLLLTSNILLFVFSLFCCRIVMCIKWREGFSLLVCAYIIRR